MTAKDYFCPVGSRGFCKHIAALAYKLVDVIMTGSKELPRQKVMKRKLLQDIVFEKHFSTRDVKGGRK